MTVEYEYTLYAEDGRKTTGKRSKPFTLNELKEMVKGRIEILPGLSAENLLVVCEDGAYRFGLNAAMPRYFGPVLVADSKLVD